MTSWGCDEPWVTPAQCEPGAERTRWSAIWAIMSISEPCSGSGFSFNPLLTCRHNTETGGRANLSESSPQYWRALPTRVVIARGDRCSCGQPLTTFESTVGGVCEQDMHLGLHGDTHRAGARDHIGCSAETRFIQARAK